MPSFFYHLKFELYPSADPVTTTVQPPDTKASIWLPPRDTDIFTADLPRHAPAAINHRSARNRSENPKNEQRNCESIAQTNTPRGGSSSAGAVIDCGPARAPGTDEFAIILSALKPKATVALGDPKEAVRDWRFSPVRVESVDMGPVVRPGHRRGESSSGNNGIIAGLASPSSSGKVTKARYEPLEGKNTELGWGIVHLYRDGEESMGLGEQLEVYPTSAPPASLEDGQEDSNSTSAEDCTTLCIPAVPSYLTPSDFLGFVGEKTREEVSHFRMVMTGRMNRYLVLMKFRTGAAAKRWRTEWDGKVFNSMESALNAWTIQLAFLQSYVSMFFTVHVFRNGEGLAARVGCGRYKGGHAKEHWKDSAHNFALEIETQHVWDYAGDIWVHRLIRNKGDGKVVELPPNRRERHEEEGDNMEMVPREKLENIGMEYTHLLTSQLESQRVYYEELVSKAVAKASSASTAAAQATARVDEATVALKTLQISHAQLVSETIPSLERDIAREKKRADKSSDIARAMSKSLTEEKATSEGLLKRIEHVNQSTAGLARELSQAKEENEELKEQNRDLLFSITAGDKIRAMGDGGDGLESGELEGASVGVPEKKRKGKGKR
ncbi:Zn-finger in ubiquitin-hydrolase [Phlyctema vagabunda]|uniref:Zn-finger in ubiquitin-hydrolase n=1 Tax=Phlyctema vagabunda TaxID=108571 RepID=A0ABR4PJW9_9HELO